MDDPCIPCIRAAIKRKKICTEDLYFVSVTDPLTIDKTLKYIPFL